MSDSHHWLVVDVKEVTHLPYRGGKEVDYLLMGHGHHWLVVDVDDAMPHSDTASLRNPSAEQRTNLNTKFQQIWTQSSNKSEHKMLDKILVLWRGKFGNDAIPVYSL